VAAAIIPIAGLVIPLVAQFLPQIIQLFQHAHPIPVDATPTVKADLNALKAAGALQTAMGLVGQIATSGKIPVSASDPSVIAAVSGALEALYQTMKANQTLNAPLVAAVPVASAPVAALTPQVVSLASAGGMVVVTA
jgi:hypothetical protein